MLEKPGTGIRTTLMHEGLECYSPRVRLSKSHVERILKKPFYTGSFLWNGVLYKGTHTALVSRGLFEQVGHAMRNRQRGKHRKQTFAFSGLLVCGKCGCVVTAEVKKGQYVYYHCTKSRSACDEVYYQRNTSHRSLRPS